MNTKENEWKREAVFLQGQLTKLYGSYVEVVKDLLIAHAEIIRLLEEKADDS